MGPGAPGWVARGRGAFTAFVSDTVSAPSTYNVAVSGMGDSDTIIASILADRATDQVGNGCQVDELDVDARVPQHGRRERQGVGGLVVPRTFSCS